METSTIILLLIGWTILSFFIGTVGADRKIGQTGAFWVSFLTSPIIGLLVILASDKIEEGEKPRTEKLANVHQLSSAEHIFATQVCDAAAKHLTAGDVDAALKELEECYTTIRTHPLVNFNLACCYSRKENAVASLKYLKDAIRNGYYTFDHLKKDPDLQFLREQEEYKVFANAGFDVNAIRVTEKPNNNKYELLEKIGKLKQDGVLSQEEFEKEKTKILSM
jgi:hypothetical protein